MNDKNKIKKQLAKVLAGVMVLAMIFSYAPIRANEVEEDLLEEESYSQVAYLDFGDEYLEYEEVVEDIEVDDEIATNVDELEDVDLVYEYNFEAIAITDGIISIEPFSIDSGGGTVPAGSTVTVDSNITGDITILNGGTLLLDANFTITGTVNTNPGGRFYMSAGRIQGNVAFPSVSTSSVHRYFNMTGGIVEGTVGGGFSTGITSNLTINISGDARIRGTISNTPGNNRHINMTGGVIEGNVHLWGNSLNMSGGRIQGDISTGGGVIDMSNGEIEGNVQLSSGATFNMSGGRITGSSGRGVSFGAGARNVFNMTGGIIEGNTGGVSVSSAGFADESSLAVFNMSGDAIIRNNATTDGSETVSAGTINSQLNGGGVRVGGSSTFNMSGNARIYNNTAVFGGGVAVDGNGRFVMSENARIEGNTAFSDGGGIRNGPSAGSNLSRVTTIGHVSIVNNTAINGNGGGIATPLPASRINLSENTIFNGNSAVRATQHPEDALTSFPNIRFASTSISDHVLNNYDIIFNGPTLELPDPVTHDVTFNLHGGTGTFPVQSVEDGELATAPTAVPIRTGYTFTGWFTTATGNVEFNFATPITADTVVHAQWERVITPVHHDVTFNLHGGTGSFPTQEVEDGELATAPTATPTRSGYTFTGWFTTATGNVEFNFATPIIADTVVHAQWGRVVVTPMNHDVTFNLHGGTGTFPVQSVEAGALATAPTAVPIRTGYTFTGWFTTATGNVEFNFATPITANTVIHAQWERDIVIPGPELPTIDIEVDEDGNVTVVITPEGDYDVTVDEDGNIIITVPDGDINITVPEGWEYDVTLGEDGSVIVIIVPLSPELEVEGMTPEVDLIIPEEDRTPAPTPTRPTLPQTGATIGSSILVGFTLASAGTAIASKKKKDK